MPIRESEKARYPKDWKAISKRIRDNAGNRCEQCQAENGTVIRRFQSEDYHFEHAYVTLNNEVFSAVNGRKLGMDYFDAYQVKDVRIVLTVAHLDHQPENCADDNLRAWCQRCHLAYDAKHHAKNGRETRQSRKAVGDLFVTGAAAAVIPLRAGERGK